MAITILERPIGVLLGTCVEATINEDYNGFATVNKTTHGLGDNQWVYIYSNVEDYNGFYQVDVINANEFALRQSNGVYLPYVVTATITYCPGESTHGWNCVHLPITYKISNNRFPTNSVDTTRTITALTNDLGLSRLTLSGSLGTFEDLSFVKISGAADSSLNGIYQILDKISTTSIVLNVAYGTFTNANIIGASIQLYYGNYNVVVRVYAGINASHEWAALKPYELAATLELTPDENNQVFFSINDILKSYVETKNNLLLASLPNNVDAWVNFYISTGESYDTSNGYTVATFATGFTSDQSTFEGTAVNAMLEFKNRHSGSLSEYIPIGSETKLLTLFEQPVIFSGQYFDFSFLKTTDNEVTVEKVYYNTTPGDGVTVSDTFTCDSGVIRYQIEANCSYTYVDVTVTEANPVTVSPSLGSVIVTGFAPTVSVLP